MRGTPRAANDEVRRERRPAGPGHPKLASSSLVKSRSLPILEMTGMGDDGLCPASGGRRHRMGLGVGLMGATRRR